MYQSSSNGVGLHLSNTLFSLFLPSTEMAVLLTCPWQDPTVVVTVDNCYGEFTEDKEPCAVGADLCMGSLIKNPGEFPNM
jgi:cystathionine beta-lyase family protein involved in aluminum resistance